MRDYMFGNYLRELRSLSRLSQYALGVAETVRALTLIWYKQNRPSSFDDAVADTDE